MKIQAAIGTAFNAQGEILIARRRQHDSLGGLWEFPGGRIEDGETAEEAVIREWYEEMNLKGTVARKLATLYGIQGYYPVDLHFFLIENVQGDPIPVECSAIDWVIPEKIVSSMVPAKTCVPSMTFFTEALILNQKQFI